MGLFSITPSLTPQEPLPNKIRIKPILTMDFVHHQKIREENKTFAAANTCKVELRNSETYFLVINKT